ncbi:MAG TPA: molybdopterin cofactor-binding domain-containing protein [Terriglobales bacterium]|jgi:nicotinate dehydrogenase subunit B|nr:molybdopterin cofactor-binding domain-containing protein [Terriglobales bacterium]
MSFDNELLQQSPDRVQHSFVLSRRELLKLVGAGLLVCTVDARAMQESGARTAGNEADRTPHDIASWIHIGADNSVTVFTGKTEMGQNIRTSLAQQVAEELRVPVSTIAMVMADTELCPFDMGTFGSRTTPQMGTELRNISAAARDLLIDKAAERLGVNRTQLVVADGAIKNTSDNRSIRYGELLLGQQLVKLIPDDPPLAPPEQWKVAGTPVAKVGGREFVTGGHKYTSDLARPGMLYGKVLRPSGLHSTLASLDTAPVEAQRIPDVTVVHDGDFVGVVAPDSITATRALSAIKAQWNTPPQISEMELYDSLRAKTGGTSEAREGGGRSNSHETGSVESGMASADKKIESTYTVAYIQHAPLEPRAAVAEWNGDKLTVWTGTQRPFAVRDELAQAFHIPEKNVRVIVPDTGSGYGGKHTGECAVEAARLAKAVGKPVKLQWTREEEFTWAYFRPAGVIDVRAGARTDGTLVAWEFHNYNSGPAAINTLYNVAHQRIQYHPTQMPPLRQGSYRGLAATANHFARESAMDELAHAIGMDPLEFRLKNINDPRLRAVFEAAAKRFGWGQQKASTSRGFGIAGGFDKGGYVATCAELAVDPKSRAVRIERVVEAWDCGPVVNPNGLRNQIEGAIVQGIGGALFENVHFANGRVLNPHFSSYRVPRFRDLPSIEVEIINRKDVQPFGAGETPIVGLAPAVANAIFNATSKRLRAMPLVPNGMPDQKAAAT